MVILQSLRTISFLGSLLLATAVIAAKPGEEPLDVDAVDPPDGEQGQMLQVKVVGNGFANGNTVHFLVTGSKDESQILVGPATFTDNDPEYPGFDTLTTDIEVLEAAVVTDYDVEVRAGKGRKGKGTTLFAVRQKPNDNPPVNCDDFAPGGTCTCWFQYDPDTAIYHVVDDCQTAETLFVDGSIRTYANKIDGFFTLTAVGPFNGSAVIANTNYRSQTSRLNIVVDDSAVAGCGATELQSAIRYVLDASTPGPSNPPEDLNANLAIWETSVTTGASNPLCRAFEVRRTQGYTDAWPDSLDWRVWLQDNVVSPGSYIEAGIVYHGVLKPANPTTGPLVSGNVIGAPSCVDPDAAIAIDFGPSHVVGASGEMEDEVLSNTIDMAADCGNGLESHGVGVFLQGATDGTETTAQISKNEISGAMIGVLANDDMVKVNLANNTFIGDGVDNSGDIGVCSDAGVTTTKGKRNTFIDLDDDIQTGGCLAP